MNYPKPPPEAPPTSTAERIAKTFFGVGPDEASRSRAVRRSLLGAVESAVLVPLLFYLRFGEVGGLGWGLTIFFIVYFVLSFVGLAFLRRTEFHTPVALRGDWLDRIGAFWLVSCAFGPLFGWFVTSIFPIAVGTWRWVYGLRAFLAAGLPLITALPLLRYVRGKAAWVALPLLLGVTLLAVWSAMAVSRDLLAGPLVRQAHGAGGLELYLRYTGKSLGLVR